MRPEKLCHNENLTSVNQNKQKLNTTLNGRRILNVAQMLKPLKLDRDHSAFLFQYSWGVCSCCPAGSLMQNCCIDNVRYPKKKKP